MGNVKSERVSGVFGSEEREIVVWCGVESLRGEREKRRGFFLGILGMCE